MTMLEHSVSFTDQLELLSGLPDSTAFLDTVIHELDEDNQPVVAWIRKYLECLKDMDAESKSFWKKAIMVYLPAEYMSSVKQIANLKRLKKSLAMKNRGFSFNLDVAKEAAKAVRIEDMHSFVNLKRLRNYTIAECPFHSDKRPSFYIYPENRYHCFQCAADGDGIDFYQKINGLDFVSAVKALGGANV